MNQIRHYRGMRVDGKGWTYGHVVFHESKAFIYYNEKYIVDNEANTFENVLSCIGVIPKTVGQYTGLKDKNGKEIFEGDKLSDHIGIGLVKYSDEYGAFRVCYPNGAAKWFYDYTLMGELESREIIGNIHEGEE